MSLGDFTTILKYTDQANVAHAEILQKDTKLYKDRLRYTFPIDTSLTCFAGDIPIRITFSKIDKKDIHDFLLYAYLTANICSDYLLITENKKIS